MNESDIERIIDRAVQRQLAVDPRYINAENAEEQAEAEEQIEREVEQRLGLSPDVTFTGTC